MHTVHMKCIMQIFVYTWLPLMIRMHRMRGATKLCSNASNQTTDTVYLTQCSSFYQFPFPIYSKISIEGPALLLSNWSTNEKLFILGISLNVQNNSKFEIRLSLCYVFYSWACCSNLENHLWSFSSHGYIWQKKLID